MQVAGEAVQLLVIVSGPALNSACQQVNRLSGLVQAGEPALLHDEDACNWRDLSAKLITGSDKRAVWQDWGCCCAEFCHSCRFGIHFDELPRVLDML